MPERTCRPYRGSGICGRHDSRTSRSGLIPDAPAGQRVSGAGLTRGREAPAIFVEYQTLLIQEHPVMVSHVDQRGDAALYALMARMRCFAIGDDGDIGVHHDGRLHQAPFFFRSSAAWLMAAISPNSSPKKSFGQILMFPNGSRSNGIRRDSPIHVEQK
jgi:hypothetical protein